MLYFFGEESAMMVYEGNPKHKHPWQHGKKGSLCPKSMSIQPKELLEHSILGPDGKRYATCDGQCFCARESQRSWHGYPVGWREVPEKLWRAWKNEGKIQKSDISKHW
jgi:hypothetical protein